MRTALIILIVLIVGSGIFLAWQLFGGSIGLKPRPAASATNQPVTLNFWGVHDDPAIFQPIIAAYQAQHPNVKIKYSRQEASLYESVSVNLLASQEGPDIWMIPSEWLPKHKDKLSPIPDGLLARQNIAPKKTGLFAKKEPTPTNAQLYPQIFAPVTFDKTVLVALPLSVDTLGLYGNKTLLAQHGITGLPTTWEQVVSATKTIAARNGLEYKTPALGIGTSSNVSRATDILATILMQNHTPMVRDDKGAALYNQTVSKTTGEPVQPGPAALDFYTSFASPTMENYSWSAKESNDFELFAAGKLPLLIDYSYRANDLAQRAAGLDLATGPMPQVSLSDQPQVLATSMMVGVPNVSQRQNAAWDFITFLTNKENSYTYSRAASRPPARIELASLPPSNPALSPFIAQLPAATNWYRNEVNKTNDVFKRAIDAVLAGQSVKDVTDTLTKQVTHILRNEPYE